MSASLYSSSAYVSLTELIDRQSFQSRTFVKEEIRNDTYFGFFEDSGFVDGALTNINFAGSLFVKAFFRNMRGDFINFSDINSYMIEAHRFDENKRYAKMFHYLTFADSEFLAPNFSGADLRLSWFIATRFINGNFREADFSHSRLCGCIFINCDFTDAQFVGTSWSVDKPPQFIDCYVIENGSKRSVDTEWLFTHGAHARRSTSMQSTLRSDENACIFQ